MTFHKKYSGLRRQAAFVVINIGKEFLNYLFIDAAMPQTGARVTL